MANELNELMEQINADVNLENNGGHQDPTVASNKIDAAKSQYAATLNARSEWSQNSKVVGALQTTTNKAAFLPDHVKQYVAENNGSYEWTDPAHGAVRPVDPAKDLKTITKRVGAVQVDGVWTLTGQIRDKKGVVDTSATLVDEAAALSVIQKLQLCVDDPEAKPFLVNLGTDNKNFRLLALSEHASAEGEFTYLKPEKVLEAIVKKGNQYCGVLNSKEQVRAVVLDQTGANSLTRRFEKISNSTAPTKAMDSLKKQQRTNPFVGLMQLAFTNKKQLLDAALPLYVAGGADTPVDTKNKVRMYAVESVQYTTDSIYMVDGKPSTQTISLRIEVDFPMLPKVENAEIYTKFPGAWEVVKAAGSIGQQYEALTDETAKEVGDNFFASLRVAAGSQDGFVSAVLDVLTGNDVDESEMPEVDIIGSEEPQDQESSEEATNREGKSTRRGRK